MYVCVFSRVQLFTTPWTVADQASLSMEFSKQECWSGLLFPTPGHLPDSLVPPTLAGGFFTADNAMSIIMEFTNITGPTCKMIPIVPISSQLCEEYIR